MPAVPPAMAALAGCRGEAGCPSKDAKVILSVGGYSYSMKAWSWLASQEAAEAMAEKVAEWEKLGVDGIDLDIEGTAGNSPGAAKYIVAFARKLKTLRPNFLVTQPVYGYPQIAAENSMVNNGWDNSSRPTGIVDSIGIMVYQGVGSLQYVKDYANATSQWQGFPIKVDVPKHQILPGIQGSASDAVVMQMAQAVKQQGLGGFMVWFASVEDSTRGRRAFSYSGDDATPAASEAWAKALHTIN
eukprot:Sspe_Gene.3258::Locus_1067_Transcript_1_1_Confidence_1.000_Length_1065::g.3258::m.3258